MKEAVVNPENSTLYTFALGAFLAVMILNMMPSVFLVDARMSPLLVLLGICLPWLLERPFRTSERWILMLAMLYCAFAAGVTAANLMTKAWWFALVFLPIHLFPCCIVGRRLLPGAGAWLLLGAAGIGCWLALSGNGLSALGRSEFLMLLPFCVGILLFGISSQIATNGGIRSRHAVGGVLFYCSLYLLFNF